MFVFSTTASACWPGVSLYDTAAKDEKGEKGGRGGTPTFTGVESLWKVKSYVLGDATYESSVAEFVVDKADIVHLFTSTHALFKISLELLVPCVQ